MLEKKEKYNYSYKRWETIFNFSNDSIKLEVKCWTTQGGSMGFQHRCYVYLNDSFEVYKNKFFKVQYYNRTWEKYQYQSLLYHVFNCLEKDKIFEADQIKLFKEAIEKL